MTNLVTLFSIACQNGHLSIVKLLLEDRRAEVNQSTKGEDSPLHIACQRGHSEIVALLLKDIRVEIDQINNDRETPYEVALKREDKTIAKLFKSIRGYTPLASSRLNAP